MNTEKAIDVNPAVPCKARDGLVDLKRVIPTYVIIALAALLWGGEYVRREMWEPDEARFALIAREMHEGGHWLVPFRQGEFYSHKPPLMFWLINAFSAATGGQILNPLVRLPSFLGAVMALWAASRLASLWFSLRAGWWTVLVLSSSYLFWNKGGFGQIDALLCGLELMALYFLFTSTKHSSGIRQMAAYVFMGLAVLAKGPVGLIIPLGSYIAAILFAGEWSSRPRKHLIWGPLVALAIPGAWLLAAWLQGAPPGFFDELLFKQNIGRMSGEFGGHDQPFYYFLKYFPLDFLPWTFLLPLSYAALRRCSRCDIHRRRLVAWIVFVIVFFSLSASKRNLYILSVYPAAAMLVAGGVGHWHLLSTKWLRNSFYPVWSLITLLGIAMTVGAFLKLPFPHPISLLPGGLSFLAGSLIAMKWWRQDAASPRWFGALAGATLLSFACIGAIVYPVFNPLKVPNEIVQPAQSLLQRNDRIIMYRQNGEIYSYYAHRMGYMANSREKFVHRLATEEQANHMIIAYERDLPELYEMIDPAYEASLFKMGNKKLAWIVIEGPPKWRKGFDHTAILDDSSERKDDAE